MDQNKDKSSFSQPLPGNPLVTLHRGDDGQVSMGLRFNPRNAPEVKTLDEWAQRWGISRKALIRRLRDPRGCWPNRALMLPEEQEFVWLAERDGLEVDGEMVPLAEVAKGLGLQKQSLLARLRNGWPVEQALQVKALGRGRPKLMRVEKGAPKVPANAFEYLGVLDNLRGHCERLGLNYLTVLARTQNRTLRHKQPDGTIKEFFYEGVSKEDALRMGRRKAGAWRRTRSDKGKPRPHLSVPFGPYRDHDKELLRYGSASPEAPEAAQAPVQPVPPADVPELDLRGLDAE